MFLTLEHCFSVVKQILWRHENDVIPILEVYVN